jgi:hypothetical protein
VDCCALGMRPCTTEDHPSWGSVCGDGRRAGKAQDLSRWPLAAIGTLVNHEDRQNPPTISQVDDPQDVPDAFSGRHRARVFIGFNKAPGRPAT